MAKAVKPIKKVKPLPPADKGIFDRQDKKVHIIFDKKLLIENISDNSQINSKLDHIIKTLSQFNIKLNKMATKQEQLQASIDEIAAATTAIGDRIQVLIDGQTAGDTVTQESLDALQAEADLLKGIGTPTT